MNEWCSICKCLGLLNHDLKTSVGTIGSFKTPEALQGCSLEGNECKWCLGDEEAWAPLCLQQRCSLRVLEALPLTVVAWQICVLNQTRYNYCLAFFNNLHPTNLFGIHPRHDDNSKWCLIYISWPYYHVPGWKLLSGQGGGWSIALGSAITNGIILNMCQFKTWGWYEGWLARPLKKHFSAFSYQC